MAVAASGMLSVHVHTLTNKDIDNKKIILPNTIMSVLAVYLKTDPSSNSISSSSNLQMQAYFSDLIMQTYNTQGSIANYAITQSPSFITCCKQDIKRCPYIKERYCGCCSFWYVKCT